MTGPRDHERRGQEGSERGARERDEREPGASVRGGNEPHTPEPDAEEPGPDRVPDGTESGRPAGADPSVEFNALFNYLDAHLRRELRIERRYDFMDLVNEGARRGIVPAGMVNELRDCKALRNLLVHTARHPHDALAQPSDYGLERFREIVAAIADPVRVFPTFRRTIRPFGADEPLTKALRFMAEHEFSQVVVRDDGRLAVLSSEGVTRWLAALADDTVPMASTTIGDVLEFEPEGTFALLPRSATIDEARDFFDRAPGLPQPRVHAVIITEHGRDTEQPLGFATPWDLVPDEQ